MTEKSYEKIKAQQLQQQHIFNFFKPKKKEAHLAVRITQSTAKASWNVFKGIWITFGIVVTLSVTFTIGDEVIHSGRREAQMLALEKENKLSQETSLVSMNKLNVDLIDSIKTQKNPNAQSTIAYLNKTKNDIKYELATDRVLMFSQNSSYHYSPHYIVTFENNKPTNINVRTQEPEVISSFQNIISQSNGGVIKKKNNSLLEKNMTDDYLSIDVK